MSQEIKNLIDVLRREISSTGPDEARLLTLKNSLNAIITPSSPPYKVYSALLFQEANNAPIVTTVFENTFGAEPTFGRIDQGLYTMSLVGVVEGKTTITGKPVMALGDPNAGIIYIQRTVTFGILGANELSITTFGWNSGQPNQYALGDNILDGTSTWIEVRVYN